jgi:dTDP-4-amino-4,6-dideoxygalactose transaminase
MIPVTKSFLPPIEEYTAQIQRAYNNQWLTNRGELVLELEQKLKDYLSINYITITTNGTLPIQIALKLFGKNKEIITTPFSYIATTASIIWENCKPVFVDIHPDYLTIDETKIESSITEKTTCILVTHVFGNPCNIEIIESIAKKYNLKIIYDAAHCFGVEYNNQSIFNFGDVSTCSFHATKLFHTGEGGAMICNDEKIYKELYYHHNFGHNGPLDFHGLGINAKVSELQAAMGIAMLPYINSIIIERKRIVEKYNNSINFKQIKTIRIRDNTKWNYNYYPIIFEHESILLKVEKKLKENNIVPRRYFYPSLNTIPYVDGKNKMEISENIASCILCLPLFVGLTDAEILLISKIINQTTYESF